MTTTSKPKKLCWFSLYVFADKALLPTTRATNQGDFDVEPVKEIYYRNRAALIGALSEAFAIGNPKMDPPDKQTTPMEIRSKSKSWADLERKSIYFSIKCYPSEFWIKSWGRSPDGKWSDDLLLDMHIPTEHGLEAVADAIINHLNTRRDLPGLMSESA